MNKSERKRKRKEIKRIADNLSDDALGWLYGAAVSACDDDPDCQGSGDPGSGEPPPDEP